MPLIREEYTLDDALDDIMGLQEKVSDLEHENKRQREIIELLLVRTGLKFGDPYVEEKIGDLQNETEYDRNVFKRANPNVP